MQLIIINRLISNLLFDYRTSMNYSTSPAWSIKGKQSVRKLQISPSPDAYNPQQTTTLNKTPSWKIGRQIRGKAHYNKNPAPNTYNPPSACKNSKMGIIGHEKRGKQNINGVPGPGAYIVQLTKDTTSVSFGHQSFELNKTINFPGPGAYQVQPSKEKIGVKVGREKRFTTQSQAKDQPGPGKYEWVRPNSATISFSKAERMSLKKQTLAETIGPGQYKIKSMFDSNVHQSKGFSLGIKMQTSPKAKSPGPGQYSPKNGGLQSTPSITFSMKYRERPSNKTPSPNQYDPQYKKLTCTTETYSIGKAERLPLYEDNHLPGPGAYLSTHFQNSGIQISLGMGKKINDKNQIPGPGAYNPSSDAIKKRPQSAKLGKSKRFQTIKTEADPSPGDYESRISLFQTPKFSFARKKRLETNESECPGPGSYNIPGQTAVVAPYALK